MINLIKKWLISLGSPPFFFTWASKFLSWFYPISFLLLLTGLIWGIGFAPSDYKQGEVYRIIFIHVPSAILGQSVYLMMAFFGFICLYDDDDGDDGYGWSRWTVVYGLVAS